MNYHPQVKSVTVPAGGSQTLAVSGAFFYVVRTDTPINVSPDNKAPFLCLGGMGKTVPQFSALILTNPAQVDSNVVLIVDFGDFTSNLKENLDAPSITTSDDWTVPRSLLPGIKALHPIPGILVQNGITYRRKEAKLTNVDGANQALWVIAQNSSGLGAALSVGVPLPINATVPFLTSDTLYISNPANLGGAELLVWQSWVPLIA